MVHLASTKTKLPLTVIAGFLGKGIYVVRNIAIANQEDYPASVSGRLLLGTKWY